MCVHVGDGWVGGWVETRERESMCVWGGDTCKYKNAHTNTHSNTHVHKHTFKQTHTQTPIHTRTHMQGEIFDAVRAEYRAIQRARYVYEVEPYKQQKMIVQVEFVVVWQYGLQSVLQCVLQCAHQQ